MQRYSHLTSGENYQHTNTLIRPQKDAREEPRNLGAMLSPEGNNQDGLKKLIQHGKTMSLNLSASTLLRHEVLIAYHTTTMLLPAMKYPVMRVYFYS